MSSIGATSTPRRAKTCQSNLTFWPIFNTPGASNSGLSSAIASASAIWLRQQPAAVEQAAFAGVMADRDVAGLARRDGERSADQLGLLRIERTGLGVEGDDARLIGAGDPGFERRGVADGGVGREIEGSARALAA